MPSPAGKINAFTKLLNQLTESELSAAQVKKLETLRAEIGNIPGQAPIEKRTALQNLREETIDVPKRQKLVNDLNEGKLSTHWLFELRNGRIMCQAKPIPVPEMSEAMAIVQAMR